MGNELIQIERLHVTGWR